MKLQRRVQVSEQELQALRDILDVVVPNFSLFGYNKQKFIDRMVKEAGKDQNMTSLKLRTVFTTLRRVYT